ncbi:MAG: hypothetical protein KatS3mg044_0059 [Rhodothermaceae bacterium]|nr:MAG: hypothetical protein KatS3mg044_0059 [Rhodothermaceae bacterium]
MRRILLLMAFIVSAGLSSCQCSDKPPIGPVEGEQTAVVMPGMTDQA